MPARRFAAASLALVASCLIAFLSATSGFLLPGHSFQTRSGVGTDARETTTPLSMGIFDSISKAFSNEEYGAPPEAVKATARHILVESAGEAKVIMKMISSGEKSFADCAREFSSCPSANQGGSLGNFPPGRMVPEFDKAIFNPDTKTGEVIGPILTEFGHHVIVVDKRTGGGDWY